MVLASTTVAVPVANLAGTLTLQQGRTCPANKIWREQQGNFVHQILRQKGSMHLGPTLNQYRGNTLATQIAHNLLEIETRIT